MRIKLPPVFFVQAKKVFPNGFLLFHSTYRRIGQQRQQVVFFRDHVGFRVVGLLVDVDMVVRIVCRYPGENREAVKNSEEIIGERVQPFYRPHGQVLVVVNHCGNNDRHEQLQGVTKNP